MKFDFRLIALVALIVASAYSILSPLFSRIEGVYVVSLSEDNKCSMKIGDVITSVSGQSVRSKEDFYRSLKDVKKGVYISMVVNGGPGGCTALEDGYVGVNVSDVHGSKLMFGIDIQGGITYLLKTEDPEKLAKILEKRATIFGVPDFKLNIGDSSVSFTTLSESYVQFLLDPCELKATILESVEISDGTGYLPVGDKVYTVELRESTIIIDSNPYKINESFNLDGIEFLVKNITNASVVLEAKIFDNKNIVRTLSSGTLRYDSLRKVYEITVPIEISSEAARNFYKVLKNAPTFSLGGRTYVEGWLLYYLDGKVLSQLNIPTEIVSEDLRQISILGFSENIKEAAIAKSKILAGVETGILPDVEVVSVGKYEATSKEFWLMVSGAFLLISSFSIFLIFIIVYKKFSIAVLTVFTTLGGIFIILGIAAFVQQMFGLWVINEQTLIGIFLFTIFTYSRIFLAAENVLRKRYFLTLGGKLDIQNLSDMSSIALSFLLIFTPFRFTGLSLLVGIALTYILLRPIIAKKF